MSLAARIAALVQAVAMDVKALYTGKVDKLAEHSLISNAERVRIANSLLKTENSASASKLQTARLINGIPFSGEENINITADRPYNGYINLSADFESALLPGKYLVNNAVLLEGVYSHGILFVDRIGDLVNQTYYAHLSSNIYGRVWTRQSWNASASVVGWSEWVSLDPLANQSKWDQTPGRVMRNGDLGYAGDIPTYTRDINNKEQRGWSYTSVPSGTIGTLPVGYEYGLLHTFGSNGGLDQTFQELYTINGYNGIMPKYIRNTYGGASEWTAWRRVLDTESVIGPLHLGAWCQIDRTAAGDVYRYADGRMRVLTPWVRGYSEGQFDVAIPAAFVGIPTVNAHVMPYQSFHSLHAYCLEGGAVVYSDETLLGNDWRLAIEGRWKA